MVKPTDRRKPKLELLDRLITLLQQRHGREEAYAKRVKELGATHGRDLIAGDTNFNRLDMTSMELIIEALEKRQAQQPDNADLNEARIVAEEVLRVVATHPDAENIREFIGCELDITDEAMEEYWYTIQESKKRG